MSWHPNDLVTDTDLLAYERHILSQFGQVDWQARRQKALEDWLFLLLEASGFDPRRLRTRFTPDAVLGHTSSTWTDRTGAATTQDGLDLATTLAASSDGLYIGSTAEFRGLSVRMHESVSAVTGSLSVEAWTDTWGAVTGLDNATASGMAAFARGGAITWTLPETLVRRTLDTAGPYYWVRLRTTAAPTGAKAGPLLVIRRSRLCAAVTFRTLALIFREAPTGQDGPWTQKAEWYEAEAEKAWLRAADRIGGEFDSDGDDAISPTEADQTAAAVSGGGWTVERR